VSAPKKFLRSNLFLFEVGGFALSSKAQRVVRCLEEPKSEFIPIPELNNRQTHPLLTPLCVDFISIEMVKHLWQFLLSFEVRAPMSIKLVEDVSVNYAFVR
jgi:hypothetical protein